MKRGGPTHPKLLELCDILGCRRPTAVGYLELLWHFTANYAPRGDIGRFSDHWIESACDWTGPHGKLLAALIKVGYVDHLSGPPPGQPERTLGEGDMPSTYPRHGSDMPSTYPQHGSDMPSTYPQHDSGVEKSPSHRLLVHDWIDHADEAVRKRLYRQNQQLIGKVTGHADAARTPHGGHADAARTPHGGHAADSQSQSQSQSQSRRRYARDTSAAESNGGGGGKPQPPLPKTGKYIRARFPDVDDRFLSRLERECKEAATQSGNSDTLITDAFILKTIQQCTKKNQESAGLYLKTVPACIRTWGHQQ